MPVEDNAFEINEAEFQNPRKVLSKIDLGSHGKRDPEAIWVVEGLERFRKSKTRAPGPPRDPSVSLIWGIITTQKRSRSCFDEV